MDHETRIANALPLIQGADGIYRVDRGQQAAGPTTRVTTRQRVRKGPGQSASIWIDEVGRVGSIRP